MTNSTIASYIDVDKRVIGIHESQQNNNKPSFVAKKIEATISRLFY